MPPSAPMDESRPGDRLLLAAVIALHGAALLLLSRLPQQLPVELALPPVLVAALIQTEATPLPQPAVVTAQPRIPVTPLAPLLTTSAASAETAPVVEPQPPTEVSPPALQTVADEAVAPPLQAVASATAPAAQPEPIQPPRFDANYLDNPAPAYPPLSRRLREQGTVLLRVHVDANGAAAQVELKQSSGHARLDQTAMDTVQRWRFTPARQGGAAVAGWVIVPVSFTLRS